MNINTKKLVPFAIATAVATACGAASAATLSFVGTAAGTDPRYVGTEKAAADVAADAGSVVTGPGLSFVLGSNSYQVGDNIALTFSGANIRSISGIKENGGTGGTISCSPTAAGGNATGLMSLTYKSVTANVATLQVASVSGKVYSSNSDALTCSIDNNTYSFEAQSFRTAGTVTVNYSATSATSGFAYDTLEADYQTAAAGAVGNVKGARTIAVAVPQFIYPTATTRNPFTGALVASGTAQSAAVKTLASTLKAFTGGTTTDANYTDYFTYTTRNEGSATGMLSGTGSVKLTANYPLTVITGDFSFLDDNADGVCTIGDLTQGAGTAVRDDSLNNGTLTISSNCKTLTFTHTSTADKDSALKLQFLLGGATKATLSTATTGTGGSLSTGKAMVNPNTLVATTTYYADAAYTTPITTLPAVTVGSWATAAASGGTVNIPYLPYGTGISRVVYASNPSTTTDTVLTFTAKGDGITGTCSSANFSAVTVKAGAVALLTSAIDAGIQACTGSAGFTGKVQVDVISTGVAIGGKSSAANAGVVVTSNYNVSGNRVNVINSSN